ncbi:hypothetical protein LCGC14_2102890, partial [marine sediment metagenome]
MVEPLLEANDLKTYFFTEEGVVKAVDGITFDVRPGEILGLVGESGCGKSVSALSILQLIPSPPGRIVSGQVLFEGRDLSRLKGNEIRRVRGRRIAMIFQDPLSHLNPVYSVGWQIIEMMRVHGVSGADARKRAIELLHRVGIPDPEARMRAYPHQFSGGQRQRLMIAMALALKPDILIADEPTTALDVTVQAQILALLEELQAETGMGLLLITHDLGVVAEVADRVVVMKQGEIVEEGDAAQVYRTPSHPYTRKLIAAAPGRGEMAPDTIPKAEPLLRAERVSKSYGGFEALSAASFE